MLYKITSQLRALKLMAQKNGNSKNIFYFQLERLFSDNVKIIFNKNYRPFKG